ncbi:MAG TPA: ATP-binding cassette domain-containing protein [Thermoanaerobaculia bacterium]
MTAEQSMPDNSLLVSLRGVRKQFATVRAVDDVTLDIPAGGVFALLGPNGAGKTTLLRMLLGLILPDAGTITWHTAAGALVPRDATIGAASSGPDPGTVGYLPEDRGLYPDVEVLRTLVYFGTLRGMTRAAARTAALEWLERLDLADRAQEPLKSLSKGNQQKVQFISAVLHGPRLAVLDEPFSGLDPLNQDLFLSLIRELAGDGATVVLSAHQLQLVERVADALVVVNRGQVVLHGTVEEVRNWRPDGADSTAPSSLHDVYVASITDHNGGVAAEVES